MDTTHREQLFAIFGSDIDLVANDLDVAAREYRENAAHLDTRQPDGLITAPAAAHMAAGHRRAAERCDRVAARIRDTLAGTDATTDPDPRPTDGPRQ